MVCVWFAFIREICYESEDKHGKSFLLNITLVDKDDSRNYYIVVYEEWH